MSGVEGLRRTVRKLENALDAKLVAYSKISNSFEQATLLSTASSSSGNSNGGGGGASFVEGASSMHVEIEDLLGQLQAANEQMRQVQQQQGGISSSSHVITHHRQRLHDYTADFRRIAAAISDARAHAQLLSTVRQDISSYKQSGAGGAGTTSREELLMRERDSAASAQAQLERVLGSAAANRASLVHQRNVLDQTLAKARQVAGLVPGLNGIMTKIRTKKLKDFVILGAFIGVLITILILYAR